MNINILGSGGAFDIKEGNSSFLVASTNGNYLVDCGWSVYPKLKAANLTDAIDAICVTHTHDDHIGSLSNLIFDRWYLHNKPTAIITAAGVRVALSNYFRGIVGVEPDMILFIDGTDDVKPIVTTGLHYPFMPSCGFDIKEGEERLIISGDIGVPLTVAPDFNEHALDPTLTYIFHDATTIEGKNFPHCHYSMLQKLAEKFYVLGYHNNQAQEAEIAFNSDINSVRLFK